jgi:hypothetical protein
MMFMRSKAGWDSPTKYFHPPIDHADSIYYFRV